jgi:hypothetical protein
MTDDDSQVGAVYKEFMQAVHPFASQLKHFDAHFVQTPLKG